MSTTPAPNGAARTQVWISLAGLGIVLIGAIFALYLTASTAYSTANELRVRVSAMERTQSEDRAQIALLCSALTEVETQFKASDQARNLMHANDLRVTAIIWHQAMKSDYPIDNAYYPAIARDSGPPCKN